MNKERWEYLEYGLLTVVSLLCYLFVLQLLTGQYLWEHNTYNTYALQADSWRQGRLDLGENYSWLEIAEYNGKYYCSFPPFPSYVLFPLTLIFGSNTPDGLVLLFFDVMAVVFLYKIAITLKLSPRAAALSALFFSICTNMTFVFFVPSVWFFAQTLSYSLATAAIYYALKGKGSLSLFLWSCGVGCRPMQAFFVPVLLLILYQKEREKHPEEKWYMLILNKADWGLPALGVAISYMVLNYLRFGNIVEFGHNYLPEFVYEHKQFSTDYLANNFKMLMNLPDFTEEGRMLIDHFGNLNFLWVNPPILIAVFGIIFACIKKEKKAALLGGVTILLSVVYLIVTMMHATMGGWHFGNRYTNDILPWLFVCFMLVLAKHNRLVKWQIPFAIWGILFNVVGTIIVYNGLG
ncbi:MAG: hypothetical protein KIH00_02045 [Lachnospiraceae bacterium]|nr:hypothetical protein [Lachnospiraceae bacterium]